MGFSCYSTKLQIRGGICKIFCGKLKKISVFLVEKKITLCGATYLCSTFNIKTAPLIRPLLGSTKGGLNSESLLYNTLRLKLPKNNKTLANSLQQNFVSDQGVHFFCKTLVIRIMDASIRVLQKVLSLGSVLHFIKHIFISNLQSIPPLLKHIFCNLFTQTGKAD